jgi:tetratricopeptide (TPR) repeat protein
MQNCLCRRVHQPIVCPGRVICNQRLALFLLWALCLSATCPAASAQSGQAELFARQALQLAQSGKLKQAELALRRAVALDPSNAEYLADLGGILGMEHHLKESGVFFARALRLDPGNGTLRRNLAANEWQLHELARAKQNLERLLRDDPNDRASTLLLGMVEADLKNFQRGALLLGSVSELTEQHPESLAALARCYYHIGETKRARATLMNLTSRFASPQSVFLGGEIAEEGGDAETAERLYREVQNTYSDSPRLLYHLAHAEYLAGGWSSCQQTLTQLVASGYRNDEIFNLLGRCYAKQNKMTEAVKAYQTAIEASPESESDYLNLASVLSDHGRRDAAIQVMAACVKALPASFNCYAEKGRIEESQHYYKQSVSSFGRAVRLSSSSADVEFGLAASLAGLGRGEEAAAAYERAIRLSPRRADYYSAYAKLLLDEAGQNNVVLIQRAADLLQKAISLDSSGGESRLLLGELWLNHGETSRAVPLLQAAARLDPQNGRPHYLLWRAYEKLGRDAEARSELDEFERLSLKGHEPKTIHR